MKQEPRLQLPDRRVMRPADRVQGHARSRLASKAFDLLPAIPTIEALAYRWARLRRPTITFHPNRPSFCLRTVRRAGGLSCLAAGRFSTHLGPPPAPDDLACFCAHR